MASKARYQNTSLFRVFIICSEPSDFATYVDDYGLLQTILADAISGFTNFFGLLKHSENPMFK